MKPAPAAIPLALYVHLPWCVRKCPYCDFNSHASRGAVPEAEYVAALRRDLALQMPEVVGRDIQTVFFGGGTPSLFSAGAIGAVLEAAARGVGLARDAEITLEANPGTAEATRFRGYRDAGVNRLSLGVQSFHDAALQQLGRIHGGAEARAAIGMARAAGFENLNLDLMFGLPGQDEAAALGDIRGALEFAPEHLSLYELTLEPNTAFAAAPPALPLEEVLHAIQSTVHTTVAAAGFVRYEVSAFARGDRAARHNLNYWSFGDYLGVGAGAHGKITGAGGVERRAVLRHPRDYMQQAGTPGQWGERRKLGGAELAFEFMLNALRLRGGFDWADFETRTGLAREAVAAPLARAAAQGLIEESATGLRASAFGYRYLNDLQLLFLPAERS